MHVISRDCDSHNAVGGAMGGFCHPLCRVLSITSRLASLPSASPPGLARAWHVLWPVTLLLWALAMVGCLENLDWRAMSLVHDAAVAAVVLAGQCRHAARRYDDDVRALIRQNDDLYERIPEGRRPPVLRVASGR